MKGFPNQIADFGKLAKGMRVAVELEGLRAKDNGDYGTALVRAGVAGTGHNPKPADQYLAEQRAKPVGSQGHRTAARGLRELYRRLGLIDDSGPELLVTGLGRQAAAFADAPLDAVQKTFWRTALTNMVFGEGNAASHPYQVLLRLIARHPGIARAKCALALEAADDSSAELDRISDLVPLSEAVILDRIGVTKANWDNAKKMLPRFAEQLGDVTRVGDGYFIATDPGGVAATRDSSVATQPQGGPRKARGSREVTAQTIAQAGLADRTEPTPPPDLDADKMAAAIALRIDRVRRHNALVRALAERLAANNFDLYEDPFDILATGGDTAFLIEVKTLDGTVADERDRVRDALAQLLYYEAFVAKPKSEGSPIVKIACFESKPSDDHLAWLKNSDIFSVWLNNDRFQSSNIEAEWLI